MPSFTKAWSLYPYETPLREAIALLKYRGKYGMASPLCRLLMAALPASLDVDVVMPVPLHPARLRGREYNQSLLLAQAVSRQLAKPLSYSNLIRVIDTAAQTTLPRSARLSNLRHAFRLRTPRTVQGQRVLVVDDVFTTGTTLHECAKTLRKAGAGDVYVLTLARTVDRGLLPDHHLPAVSKNQLQFAGL
jgi:ComF family protein